MRLFSNTSTWVITGAMAVAVPFCVAQSNPSQYPSQNPSQAASSPSRNMSANQQAANLLNTVNKNEIDDAQMIADRTDNAKVKDFAKTLINDHKEAQSKLESAASASSIELSEMNAMEHANDKAREHWKSVSKPLMNKLFVNAEIHDHMMAVKKLQSLESQITDPQLKSVVQETIPVMKKHIADAKQVRQQLGSSGSGR